MHKTQSTHACKIDACLRHHEQEHSFSLTYLHAFFLLSTLTARLFSASKSNYSQPASSSWLRRSFLLASHNKATHISLRMVYPLPTLAVAGLFIHAREAVELLHSIS
eukprot:1155679-Pelagomonas_calceolata.AAC.1